MLYGSPPIDGQAIIGASLVFNRTTDGYIIISVSPIIGQTVRKTVYTLGNHHKMQVTAATYHLPCFGPPFVSIFHKEIGSKAGVDKCSRWYLEFSVTLFTQRQVKVFCPHHHRTIHLSPGITTINITMLATCTQFMATMP